MTANGLCRMTSGKLHRMALAGAIAGVLVLSGCGSGGTKTVSVSGATTSGTITQPTTTTRTNPSSSTTTTPQTTGTSTTGTTGTTGAENTRTTTAPAFTKQATSSEGLGAAQAVVKAHGYTANDSSDYRSGQTLRVLVGKRTASGDGYGEQAFFFLGGRYIGTDASQPSASVKVVRQSDTEVMLAYPLYRARDPLCCASAGQATVRFQLNNGHLVALDPIPPAARSKTGTSRQ